MCDATFASAAETSAWRARSVRKAESKRSKLRRRRAARQAALTLRANQVAGRSYSHNNFSLMFTYLHLTSYAYPRIRSLHQVQADSALHRYYVVHGMHSLFY